KRLALTGRRRRADRRADHGGWVRDRGGGAVPVRGGDLEANRVPDIGAREVVGLTVDSGAEAATTVRTAAHPGVSEGDGLAAVPAVRMPGQPVALDRRAADRRLRRRRRRLPGRLDRAGVRRPRNAVAVVVERPYADCDRVPDVLLGENVLPLCSTGDLRAVVPVRVAAQPLVVVGTGVARPAAVVRGQPAALGGRDV